MVFHPLETHGCAAFPQYLTVLRTAFPDLHFTVEEEVTDGVKAAARFVMTGTQQAAIWQIPATGRAASKCGAWISFASLISGSVRFGFRSTRWP